MDARYAFVATTEAPEPEAPPAESEPREEPSTTDPVRAAFDKFDADGNGTLVSVPGCLRPARLRATGLS